MRVHRKATFPMKYKSCLPFIARCLPSGKISQKILAASLQKGPTTTTAVSNSQDFFNPLLLWQKKLLYQFHRQILIGKPDENGRRDEEVEFLLLVQVLHVSH